MRLANFIAVSIVAAFGVGIWTSLNGSGIGAVVINAALTLVVLQVAYFLFLFLKSKKGQSTRQKNKVERIENTLDNDNS